MQGMAFSLDCVECGGEVVAVNSANPTRWSACAVVQCLDCNRQFSVHASLAALRAS